MQLTETDSKTHLFLYPQICKKAGNAAEPQRCADKGKHIITCTCAYRFLSGFILREMYNGQN